MRRGKRFLITDRFRGGGDAFFFVSPGVRAAARCARVSHKFNTTSPKILFLRSSTTDVNIMVCHSNRNLADSVTVARGFYAPPQRVGLRLLSSASSFSFCARSSHGRERERESEGRVEEEGDRSPKESFPRREIQTRCISRLSRGQMNRC